MQENTQFFFTGNPKSVKNKKKLVPT